MSPTIRRRTYWRAGTATCPGPDSCGARWPNVGLGVAHLFRRAIVVFCTGCQCAWQYDGTDFGYQMGNPASSMADVDAANHMLEAIRQMNGAEQAELFAYARHWVSERIF